MLKSKSFLRATTVLLVTLVPSGLALLTDRLEAQTPQAEPLATLKGVPIPEPSNLSQFVRNRAAAIKLGKALFWDMQVGSDGQLACGSCHFSAGADSRARNQVSPGLLQVNEDGSPNPDTSFTLGGPNRQLAAGDFPFHKLESVNNRNSAVLFDTNDVVSSQATLNSEFVDAVPGRTQDEVEHRPDAVFHVGGTNVRRVGPRNTPTVINAVFNYRNFWDGRAQNVFNGVNPFGLRDPNAKVVRAANGSRLEEVRVRLENSSLASQAVGPPLLSFEMSADGRTFEEIGDRFGDVDRKSKDASKGKKLPRKLAKKILPLRPLGQQLVARDDSVLGSDSRWPQTGLRTATYDDLIEDAFRPEWWRYNRLIQVDENGRRTFVNRPDRDLTTSEYTLMEYNFALFFGIAVQMYEATLVSDDTPVDRHLAGQAALTPQEIAGMQVFQSRGLCTTCHGGAEMTSASVRSVQRERLKRMVMGFGFPAAYDTGFYNIGVRPTFEDLGVGDEDPFGNPLSETRVAQQNMFPQLLGQEPNLSVAADERVAADGAFKTPGLRNVELTAPYFHNGGQLTLRQVVDFYNRGGDRRNRDPSDATRGDTTGFGANLSNVDANIRGLEGISEVDKQALVAFLKALTDERVRWERAPFDHPQLFVPNGHRWSSPTDVERDGDTINARDALVEIKAVGRNGRHPSDPVPTFEQNLAPSP